VNGRFQAGVTDAVTLHAELRQMGFTGSVQTVRRWLHPLRGCPAPQGATGPTPPRRPKATPPHPMDHDRPTAPHRRRGRPTRQGAGPLLRDGLVRILAAYDCTVVRAVASGPDLLDALLQERPDVAVVDVRLPPTFTDEGLREAIAARAAMPGLPVLVLSQYVEPLYAGELLSDPAGGVGYLLKDRVQEVDEFIHAVRRVAAGGTVMDPVVVAQLLRTRSNTQPLAARNPREREVLALMAEGRSNAAISSRLVITEKAVGKHTNNIFAKLGLPPSGDDNRRVLAVLTYLNA
jgi:DNA-binding NarL/FixJ family response regulator